MKDWGGGERPSSPWTSIVRTLARRRPTSALRQSPISRTRSGLWRRRSVLVDLILEPRMAGVQEVRSGKNGRLALLDLSHRLNETGRVQVQGLSEVPVALVVLRGLATFAGPGGILAAEQPAQEGTVDPALLRGLGDRPLFPAEGGLELLCDHRWWLIKSGPGAPTRGWAKSGGT